MAEETGQDAKTIEATAIGDPVTVAKSSEPHTIGDPDEDLVVYAHADRYESRRALGEGGMGEVRLCRDRMIGREVAMKVVLPTHSQRGDLAARFVREARVQGQLEHPAIVPVYDFGVEPSGRAFFTMRRVRGETLEHILDRLRKKDSSAEREHTRHKLLAMFVRVCLALEFAHERGVIHRDLKPANVMLGSHGEVYMLDWGLAKVQSASKSLDPQLAAPNLEGADEETPSSRRISGAGTVKTELGVVLGTPQYMSPEQIKGEAIDHRADVYALGAILFEILTLEPLQGHGSIAAILKRALQGVEARPSIRAPERDVPPELELVCVKATMRDRDERYRSARALADAVEAYLSGDRDVELRKELAQQHLERAEAAAQQALASEDHRPRALREVAHAIALAPDDPKALAVLVRLLTAPPKTTPTEVAAQMEREARSSRRVMMPRVALAYFLVPLLLLPFEVALGVRSWPLTLVPVLLWWLAAAAAWVSVKLDHTAGVFPYVTVFAAVAFGATTTYHGPLIVIPAVAAVHAMGMSLTTEKRNRRFATFCYMLGIIVPSILALQGMHPVDHSVHDGVLRISPGALLFPRSGTLAYLAAAHVVIMGVAARFGARYRDTLTEAQTKNALLNWQLRQLVPAEATRAVVAPDPSVPGLPASR